MITMCKLLQDKMGLKEASQYGKVRRGGDI